MIFLPPMPYTFDDGCTVAYVEEQGLKIARVINPNECKDKDFVQYMNCNEKLIKPKQYLPEECK